MGRVLIAWELGGNLGHLARQLPIATALRHGGHDVTFAVRDTRIAAQLLERRELPYVQAPIQPSTLRSSRPPANYAEMLLAEGYADRASLLGRVRAWLGLFDIHRPEALVIDHSPTALIAARAAGIAAIQIGTGFEIPPSRAPMPTIRPWEKTDADRLEKSEALVCQHIRDCLKTVGANSAIGTLAELFETQGRLLATFRELDHYGPRADTEYSGPLFGPASTRAVEWQSDRDRRVLAYLRNGHPGLKPLLRALRASEAEVICVVTGITEAQSDLLSHDRFRVVAQPVAIGSLLRNADVVICPGGSGTVAESLLSGVPLLLVPGTVEQFLQARCVETLGAGIVAGLPRVESDLVRSLERLTDSAVHRQRAQAFARRHSNFERSRVVERAVSLIGEAISNRRLH